METRTLIEKAKGIIIIAQQHCSPSTCPSCSAYCPSSTAMGITPTLLLCRYRAAPVLAGGGDRGRDIGIIERAAA